MTLTMESAIDQVCDKVCTQCGQELPRPGEECAACGELPGLLRQEAAEQLARPGELARMQAEYHRQEAQRLLGEQVAQLLEADQVLHVDQLRQVLAGAEAELTAGIARRDQAEAALKEPRSKEARAARERDDAASARKDFELELRKTERYKRGAKAIVLARQALTLADEELAGKDAALAAAQGAARQVEGTFAAADAEVERLIAARDAAARRLASPGTAALSQESMEALGAPVMAIAREAFAVRMSRPPLHQFNLNDVLYDNRVSFALGMAKTLGLLTGTSAAEEASGERAGRKQAKAEQDARPGLRKGRTVNDTTITAPASLPQAAPQPGGSSLALSQANPFRGGGPSLGNLGHR
jgi:hypothetical protein